eukprot:CAMPEP_0113455300 /NCGR_PEP_ID=MMETSP0014_2-20120614/8305_1 /TAXON_ID=2857 /ORGANISM="Nitzschia sp." /LENGTH=1125 /DNA_ID=CAMNT_0000346727 /DNA_START=534 /DNA_END=3911 /DNA_ORIENTATION=- /assembly_acc=CAM_ASM_000159
MSDEIEDGGGGETSPPMDPSLYYYFYNNNNNNQYFLDNTNEGGGGGTGINSDPMMTMTTMTMTMDPGWSLIVACCVACFLLYALLPCVVSLSSKYERSNNGNNNNNNNSYKNGRNSHRRARKKDQQAIDEYDVNDDDDDDERRMDHESTSSSSCGEEESGSQYVSNIGKEMTSDDDSHSSPSSDSTEKAAIITTDGSDDDRDMKISRSRNKGKNLGIERVESLIQLGYLEPTRSSFGAKRALADDDGTSSEVSISLYEQYAFKARIPSELPAPPPPTRSSSVRSRKPDLAPTLMSPLDVLQNTNALCNGGGDAISYSGGGGQFLCPMEPLPFDLEEGDEDEEEPPTIYINTKNKTSTSGRSFASIDATGTVYSNTEFVDWMCQSILDACNKPLPSRSVRLLKQQQQQQQQQQQNCDLSQSTTEASYGQPARTPLIVPLSMGNDYDSSVRSASIDHSSEKQKFNPTTDSWGSFKHLEQQGHSMIRRASSSMAIAAASMLKGITSAQEVNLADGNTDQLPDIPCSSSYNDTKKPYYSRQESNSGDISENSESVLPPLDQDDVSFTDAIDHYRTNNPTALKAKSMMMAKTDDQSMTSTDVLPDQAEIDVFCGPRAWWRPIIWKQTMDRLIHISDFDDEMWALIRTTIPLSTQALFTGGLQIIEVGLVGTYLGTGALTIFVVVGLLLWLPTTFVYGFAESIAKLIPETLEDDLEYKDEDEDIGHKRDEEQIRIASRRKAGQYFTTATMLITVGMIPIGVFWSYYTSATFEWLGMPTSLAGSAQSFAQIQVISEFLTVLLYTFHLFLDLVGLSTYSSISGLLYGVGQTAGVVVPVVLRLNGTMATIDAEEVIIYIAMLRAFIAVMHLITTTLIVVFSRLLDRSYLRGIFTMPLKNGKMTCEMFWTSFPLGFAYFLTYGEWEILGVFFARALGPTEVVTWALLGVVWYFMKYIVDGLVDATQLRCCQWLISNQPLMAKTVSQKAHFVALSLSVVLVSILFVTGNELVKWMTIDLVLQRMMIDVFPLLGLGLIVQTVGAISFSLISAQQDRVQMSHFIQFGGSWILTLVLSATFCFLLRINLQGLASAVVLGLAVSGAGQTYILMKSDWTRIATKMSRGLASSSGTVESPVQ